MPSFPHIAAHTPHTSKTKFALAASLALCLVLPHHAAHPATAQVIEAEVAGIVEADEVAASAPQPEPAASDLWTRLHNGYALAAIDPHGNGPMATRVARQLRWYQSHPAHVQTTFERARLYLFDIAQALEKDGMPLAACRTYGTSAANRPQRSIFYHLFDPSACGNSSRPRPCALA